MKKQLYEKFEEVQALGKPVGQRWFKREGKRVFAAVYSTAMDRSISQCAFSEVWFRRFCEQWNISWRLSTKAAQESPKEKQELLQAFLQKIQQNS